MNDIQTVAAIAFFLGVWFGRIPMHHRKIRRELEEVKK